MAGEGSKVTQYKPGQSGNPKGRPIGLRQDLKKYKAISATDAGKLIQKMMDMTAEELLDVMQNASMPAYEIMIASVIHKSVVGGDHSRLNFLLERTIGKVKDDKTITLKPVTYQTTVDGDGNLLQEIVEEDDDLDLNSVGDE